ncbi:hypothetical protein [Cereibacter sediminicola]|uniref:hypothetical protein n=1 Tax=Cereibacter sediminicola TaxID=2584941 RepID=UPI001FE45167|nr:hypothetical protein [Cereibacter sediminicola]
MLLHVEQAAAERPFVVVLESARLDQELSDDFRADAGLFPGGDEGMQASFRNDFSQHGLPRSVCAAYGPLSSRVRIGMGGASLVLRVQKEATMPMAVKGSTAGSR